MFPPRYASLHPDAERSWPPHLVCRPVKINKEINWHFCIGNKTISSAIWFLARVNLSKTTNGLKIARARRASEIWNFVSNFLSFKQLMLDNLSQNIWRKKLITGLPSSPWSILDLLGYTHPHFHTAHRSISLFPFHLLPALKIDKLHVI